MLILKRPWTQTPPVGLDATHWLTPLVRQGVIAGDTRNATANNPYTVNTSAVSVNDAGATYKLAGSTGHIAAPSVASNTPWTMLTYGSITAALGEPCCVATMAESPGSGTVDRSLYIDTSNAVVANVYTGSTVTATTTKTVDFFRPTLIAAICDGTNVGAYCKRELVTASTSGSYGYTGYTSPEFVMGYGRSGGAGAPSSWRASYTLLLTRALTMQELVEIESDPFAFFEPRRIYIPIQTASSGLPTLSSATYVPGSLTASGFRPRVTATY